MTTTTRTASTSPASFLRSRSKLLHACWITAIIFVVASADGALKVRRPSTLKPAMATVGGR